MILSRHNSAMRGIRALGLRKAREETGRFVAEGIRLAVAASRSGHVIETVVVAPDLLRSAEAENAIQRLTERGTEVLTVSAEVFGSLAKREHPQGIAVVGQQSWLSLDDVDPGHGLCWVALVRPQDPGNIGSVIRTCDAVGAGGVILVDDSADPYDPRAMRASMGSVFHQTLVRCALSDLGPWLKRAGAVAVGAAGKSPSGYRSVRYGAPLVLLMGSEREGLAEAEVELCDQTISIPMKGSADSLNLAVACSLILYEVFFQLGNRL